MNGSIGDWMRRPLRYVYVDGFVEIAIGGLFIVSALLILVFALALDRPPLAAAVGVGAFVLIIVLGTSLKRLVEVGKQRLTYPRTGYMRLRSDAAPGWTRVVVILAALGLASAVLFLPRSFQGSGFALGVILAVILAMFGLQTGWPRFYYLAAGVAALTILVSLWVAGEAANAAIVLAGSGALLTLSGSWALRRYLRQHASEQDRG